MLADHAKTSKEPSIEPHIDEPIDLEANHVKDVKNSSMWLHLIDSPSFEDLEYDRKSFESDPFNHIPMTTKREMLAWYIYMIAGQAIVNVGFSLIYPLYLSIISTRYACLHNTPFQCDYYNDPILADSSTLVVYIGSWSLKPESYATLMISVSGVFQFFTYLWLSSIADYANYQFYLFRALSIISDVLIIFWFFIPSEWWLFVGLYGAFILIPRGLTGIFFGPYKPILVENHWLVRRVEKKYKNKLIDEDEFQQEKKELIRTIQDDYSQFAGIISNVGSIVALMVGMVGFAVLEDVTTEISNDYGITNNGNYDGIDLVNSIGDEYWCKSIVGIDIWYSDVFNLRNNESMTYINGMRFRYGHINLNGSIYGVNDTRQFIFDDNLINISFMHSNYILDTQSAIIQINLFTINQSKLISGIQFVTSNASIIIYGGDIRNGEITAIRPDKFPKYELSGYQITTAIVNDTTVNSSIPIISGYSFAFMDIEKGQYGDTLDNRLIFSACALWSTLFALPAYLTLKSRRKPPLPKSASLCTVSIKDYYKVFHEATTYPNLFRCLIAWFIWSDALGTILSTGVIFAQVELGMTSFQITILLFELSMLSIFGAFFFIWVSKKYNVTNKRLVVFHLCVNALIPVYVALGLFPGSPIGLVHIWEVYLVCGVLLGTQMGSLFATSSSLYAHLIPIGQESQFFGLYAVTDKGSSWIGPLLASIVSNNSTMRYAIIYILFFYILSIPLLHFGVDYDQGMIESGRLIAGDDDKKPLLDSPNTTNIEDSIAKHPCSPTTMTEMSTTSPYNSIDGY